MRPFPDVVRIEPTGGCNLRCLHCPTGQRPNGRKAMSLDKFVGYFEALPLVPRVLVLYHGGEPLLNADLARMISFAKAKGVGKTVLNTNAMLLHSTKAEDVAFAGLDEMRVSIDGASADENNALRVGADFRRVVKNVCDYLDLKPDTQVTIYNVRKHSDGTTPDFIREAFYGYPVVYRNEKIRVWAGTNGQNQFEALRPNFCSNLFETFSIMSDGRVVQCCEDITGSEIIGDLNHETPLEVWERMEQRRRDFERRDYPRLCRACHIVTGFYL